MLHKRPVPPSHWLIIPVPSFIEPDTLKGFLLAHPSFLIVLIFTDHMRPCIFKKMLLAFYFLPLPSTSQPFHFYSCLKCFRVGRIVTVNTSSAQQLSKGPEWERNWSAGLRYSKQSLPVPCVQSNYEVQEVAGFAWAIKRLKAVETKKVFAKKTYN